MPKVPRLAVLPKDHAMHGSLEESSERALEQAEEENRDFYARVLNIARISNDVQLGVDEAINSRNLRRGFNISDPRILTTRGLRLPMVSILEEKVQADLYREVQGNTFRLPHSDLPTNVDTTHGQNNHILPIPDNDNNYQDSVNADHLNRNIWSKAGRQLHRVGRGMVAVVGGNNLVETEVVRRFGADLCTDTRQAFVANRLSGVIEASFQQNPRDVNFTNLLVHLGGAQNNANDLVSFLAQASFLELRTLQQVSPAVPWMNSTAYRDLLILTKSVEKNLVRSGMDRVYDHQRLRRFMHDLYAAGGDDRRLAGMIDDMLEQNSLFPLENNPEGKALLAELESRHRSSDTAQLIAELGNIRREEIPPVQDSETSKRLADEKAELLALSEEMSTLLENIRTARMAAISGVKDFTDFNSSQIKRVVAKENDLKEEIQEIDGSLEELDRKSKALTANLNQPQVERANLLNEIAVLENDKKALQFPLSNAQKVVTDLEKRLKDAEEKRKGEIKSKRTREISGLEIKKDTLLSLINLEEKRVEDLTSELAKEQLDLSFKLNSKAPKSMLKPRLASAMARLKKLELKKTRDLPVWEANLKCLNSQDFVSDELNTPEILSLGKALELARFNSTKQEVANANRISLLDAKLSQLNVRLSSFGGVSQVNFNVNPPDQLKTLLNQIEGLETKKRELNKQLRDLKTKQAGSVLFKEDREQGKVLSDKQKEAKKVLNDYENNARDLARKIDAAKARQVLTGHWAAMGSVTTALSDEKYADLENSSIDQALSQQIVDFRKIFKDLHEELNESKTTPFVLLERLMRRDYYRARGLDPAIFNTKFNEEANHYALVKAQLRVQDVKSLNLIRSSNDKAARHRHRPTVLRVLDRATDLVSRGQDLVGVELVSIENISEDLLVRQIIDSDPDFTVFRGVNKFTTTRDLRDILHKSGQDVSPEVLERFALTLEDAINKFKKVKPHLYNGLAAADWDLENLIVTLQKIKAERWSKNFLAKVEKAGGDEERERTLITMLKEARDEDQKISAEISKNVRDPDAMWRKFLVKDELKQVLDKTCLDSTNNILMVGINEKERRVNILEGRLSAMGKDEKVVAQAEIMYLRKQINLTGRQIKQSKDLYNRVETAREYIRTNNLNRKQKKLYLQEMGLTQVFDKMSTNFGMERAWHHTKQGAAAAWSGLKNGWAWSRKNVINMEKAGKAFSIGRVVATPVTWPLGKAWKWGTFPFRLAGRAVSRSTHMPKRLAGVFSDSMMRSYLRDRIIDLSEEIDLISNKQAKLQGKAAKAHYSWDKKRFNNRFNKLAEEKQELVERLEEYKKIAVEKKINLGDLSIYKEAA